MVLAAEARGESPAAADPLMPVPVKVEGAGGAVAAPPGFTVTLFAAPPKVSYPTCLAVVPQGETVYVGSDLNASLDRKPDRGRIIRCRDTDGDGKADEFTDFAKMDSPRGLLAVPGPDGRGVDLFVMHPPHLSVYRDHDGDGVAEDSKVLVRDLGFGLDFRGADHTTNAIRWGIDGWIYVAVGDYGFAKASGSDGRTLRLRGGGIVRVRPDGSELEIVSRGQRNIFDVAVSPRLDLFTLDNTNDGGGWDKRLSHVPHGGQMGYPSLFLHFSDEIVKPMIDDGGGGPTGSLFVEEPALPAGLSPALFTCCGTISRHPLTASGASFTAETRPAFSIPGGAIDLDVDSHGVLFISSWLNGGFNYGGPDVGRILRFAPPAADPPVPARAIPSPRSSIAELVAAIGATSHTCRLAAQRELLRRKAVDAAEPLRQLAASQGPLSARVAALFTYKQLRGAAAQPAIVALAADPPLREYALRALADRQGELADTPVEPFVRGLADPDPRVRLQAVRGLGRFASPGPGLPAAVVEAMVPLTHDRDPLVAHVAIDSLVRLQAVEACLAAVGVGPLEARTGAARVLQRLHLPAVIDGIEAWLERTPRAAGADPERLLVLRTLCRLRSEESPDDNGFWSTRPDTSGPYFRPVPWQETERIGRLLEREFTAAGPPLAKPLIVALVRHKIELPNMHQSIVALARDDRDFRDTAVALLAPGGKHLSPGVAAMIADVATGETVTEAARIIALRALQGRFDQPGMFEPACRSFAAVSADAPAGVAQVWSSCVSDQRLWRLASELVNRSGSEQAGEREFALAALASIGDQAQAKPADRTAAVRGLERAWNTPALTVSLLRGMGRAGIESQALQIRSRLTAADPQVREAAAFAAARLKLDSELSVDPSTPRLAAIRFEDLVKRLDGANGNPGVGRKLFTRHGCSACHSVSAYEAAKGPALLGISTRSSRAELAESIIKPSAKVLPGFVTQVFQTDDGRVHQGFVSREEGDEIEIRDTAGIATLIRREQIEQRSKTDVSPMPQGLVDTMTFEQFVSLLAYLDTLK
jgi:putative heme-binding domain-containing protein